VEAYAVAPEFSDLPPLERIQRYLDLADDARREAASAKGALRESYLNTAKSWEQLAVDTEASLKPQK
jgi:hypothetical protein